MRVGVVLSSGMVALLCGAAARGSTNALVRESYGRLPLSFQKNEGQSDLRVKYLSRGSGYTLFLCSTEAVLSLRKGGAPPAARPVGSREGRLPQAAIEASVVRMKLVDGNPHPEITGAGPLPGKSHYFIGSDPRRWRTDVPHYAQVRYHEVYPGVDLVFHGSQRQLEYDFVVSPGGDPRSIRLRFEGAEAVRPDEVGNLVLEVDGARVVQRAPYVYQEDAGKRRQVAGVYVVDKGGEVRFALGAYEASRALVIDPVLVYSTYLGGADGDFAYGIAVDASGSAYVTGGTSSTDFPTVGPLPGPPGGHDVFVTKFSPDGGSLVYSTYLGGTSADSGLGIAVDGAGSAYVTGMTASTDYPIVNPFQASGASIDGFVTKLSPSGSSLVYSTYLGGFDWDTASNVTVDAAGSAYVVGRTNSADFPTLNPVQAALGGGDDAFATKFSPTGSSLEYSTYLGGAGYDAATDVAIDSSGNAYVVGETFSADFPTVNPFQPDQGSNDAFVTKLGPTGSTIEYSTYLGGGDYDLAYGVAVDSVGSAHVAGVTNSPDFPTLNPYQSRQGGSDAFVTKLSPSGSTLEYSTYLGGSQQDVAFRVAVDGSGAVYVAGHTASLDFPIRNPVQANHRGAYDGFVTKLLPGGGGKLPPGGSGALEYSTYLGGDSDNALDPEYLLDIALHSSGDVFVAGYTSSTTFPTMDPYQPAPFAGWEAFVARIGAPLPWGFHTLTPCRAVDTRSFSGPALACSPTPTPRSFALAGSCGVPPDARAVSYNLAVTQPSAPGNLRFFPAGSPLPFASSINYAAGATRGNNGLARLSAGALALSCHQASGTAHAIIDVNGYFK